MKKIITTLCLATVLFAGETIVPKDEHLRINTNDIVYRYNYDLKKCVTTSFGYRTETIELLKNGKAIVDEKYVNDAGTSRLISYVMDGNEYQMAVMDTFGECRLFEDIMIKNMDVKDSKTYKNLKENKKG